MNKDFINRQEKYSLISSITIGILFTFIGFLGELLSIYIYFTEKNIGLFIWELMLVFFLLFVVGLTQLTKKFRERHLERQQNLIGTPAYNKLEKKIDKQLEKMELKSSTHGDFKKELYTKPLLSSILILCITSIICISLCFLSFNINFSYRLAGIGVILEVIGIAQFIISCSGKYYKNALRGCKVFKLEVAPASQEFLQGKLFK